MNKLKKVLIYALITTISATGVGMGVNATQVKETTAATIGITFTKANTVDYLTTVGICKEVTVRAGYNTWMVNEDTCEVWTPTGIWHYGAVRNSEGTMKCSEDANGGVYSKKVDVKHTGANVYYIAALHI